MTVTQLEERREVIYEKLAELDGLVDFTEDGTRVDVSKTRESYLKELAQINSDIGQISAGVRSITWLGRKYPTTPDPSEYLGEE